jgi:hypothetical protein
MAASIRATTCFAVRLAFAQSGRYGFQIRSMAAAQLAWAASLRSKFRTPHATGAEYGSRRQAGRNPCDPFITALGSCNASCQS